VHLCNNIVVHCTWRGEYPNIICIINYALNNIQGQDEGQGGGGAHGEGQGGCGVQGEGQGGGGTQGEGPGGDLNTVCTC